MRGLLITEVVPSEFARERESRDLHFCGTGACPERSRGVLGYAVTPPIIFACHPEEGLAGQGFSLDRQFCEHKMRDLLRCHRIQPVASAPVPRSDHQKPIPLSFRLLTRLSFTRVRRLFCTKRTWSELESTTTMQPDLRLIRQLLTLIALLSLAASAQQSGQPLDMDTGRAGVEQMLTKLRTTARLMQITAHPDDEDGGMLALESRGHGVTVQLMTLTRGDGGQNKTGSSFSDELGVLRTLELLESGRYYGVEQRFSRVADFGFSKTADETFQKWGGHQIALGDLVRAIRTFQPDVVAARFTGTSRDGHGHHQASGILAREAVIAAADPNQFPEQIKEGLLPWKVLKLYHDNVPPDEKNIVGLDAGAKLPYLPRSFAELGAEGYSHQKSQNATFYQVPPGPSIRRYKLIWPSEGTKDESDFFDGIETRLDHLFDRLPASERELLKAYQPKLQDAAKQIDFAAAALKRNQQSAAIPLLRGRRTLNSILDDVRRSKLSSSSKANLELVLTDKAEQFQAAANLALDLKLSATLATVRPVSFLIPGSTYEIGVTLENAPLSLIKMEGAQLEIHSPGWFATPLDRKSSSKSARYYRTDFSVRVPPEAALTRPFWHRDDPEKDNVFTLTEPKYATLPLPP